MDKIFKFGWFPRAKYRDLVFYRKADQGMNQALFDMPDTEENRAMMDALLTAKMELPKVVDCPHCNGNGYTAEHDPSSGAHDGEGNCLGSCPVAVQCETCLGTGKLACYKPKHCDDVESFWNKLHQESEKQYDKRLELLGPIETEDDAAFRKTLHDGWSAWLLAKRIVLNKIAATEPKS